MQDKEWRKEAGILWRYNDRLAALVDLMAVGGVAKLPKPPPTTLPRKSDFVAPLSLIISAAASRGSNYSTSQGCLANDEDPGRLDAASLKRVLHAVTAVESYLANSGRLELEASETTQIPQATENCERDELQTAVTRRSNGVHLLCLFCVTHFLDFLIL